jgi:hypothetical protein
MKRILDFIEQQKRELDDSPCLVFVRDRSVHPQKRLSFAPAMAPFVMGFADINKYVLRDERSEDPLQKMINTHTEEDDHHFGMFLKDLRTLELNDTMDFTHALKLLWGDECQTARKLIYELAGMIASAEPKLRLVIVEAIEAAGNTGFLRFRECADEFHKLTGKPLYYFGDMHLGLESGHAMGTENVEVKLNQIELTPEQEKRGLELAHRVFRLFHDMSEGMMQYVRGRDAGVQAKAAAK